VHTKGLEFKENIVCNCTGIVAPIPQPKNWDPMQPGQQLLIVDILMGSKEFEEVERNVKIAPGDTYKEILQVLPVWSLMYSLQI